MKYSVTGRMPNLHSCISEIGNNTFKKVQLSYSDRVYLHVYQSLAGLTETGQDMGYRQNIPNIKKGLVGMYLPLNCLGKYYYL
jgi:hypothetical protein